MYECGGVLKAIGKLRPNTVMADVRAEMLLAQFWLDWLLTRDHIPIVDVREAAERLRGFINQLAGLPDGEVLGANRHVIIDAIFSRFEIGLSVELARLHVYFVTPVLGYDSDVLLSNGRAVLTQSTLKWLPEDAAKGFDDGTRCLALKQATAAGFLFLRSVEDMMHDYYDIISNGAARPQRRNMGDYINALERLPDVSPSMLEVLTSIKNLRRNPLMHPDQRLEMDDAIETFDVAKSAISAMARQAEEHSRLRSPTPQR